MESEALARPNVACVFLATCLVFGCSGGTDCCYDHAVHAVVTGVVTDPDGAPQAKVDLVATNLQSSCSAFVETGPFMTGRTDEEGRFGMLAYLPLRPEGLYCFDMAMSMGSAADTTKQIEIWLERSFPPEDTTRVTLVASW